MLEIGQPARQGTLDFNLSLPTFQSFERKISITVYKNTVKLIILERTQKIISITPT